jgi:outer membrane protein OmpU
MNIKKIGLTALAASLVSVSAHAGALSVSGGASIGVKDTSKTSTGKSFTMGNSVTFTGSGELDNGMNVSISFELDQGAEAGTAGAAAKGPFDSHSVTVSSDELGTLVFAGHGGSSAQSEIDTTAAGDAWNNGSNFTVSASSTSNNMLLYTLPTFIDDVTAKVSYTPGAAGVDSATAWRLGYTGVEGLTVDYAQGDNETVGAKAEATTFKASYAYSSFTLSYSKNEYDTEAATGGQDIDSWNLAYTVNDDLSVAYGVETHDTEAQTVDEEAEYVNVSYTTGGVTLSASNYMYEGDSNTAGAGGEIDRWALSATFAF